MPGVPRGFSLLHQEIRGCVACPGLAPHAKFPDRDYGNLRAPAMLVGEAPGESSIGVERTWSGPAGRALRKLLREGTGMELEDAFYLTNVIKCCPPRNRDPKGAEVVNCTPFLQREAGTLRPERIVCVGRFAAQALFPLWGLQAPQPLRDVHGRWFAGVGGTRLAAIVHPSWGPRSVPGWAEGARRVLAEAAVGGLPPPNEI